LTLPGEQPEEPAAIEETDIDETPIEDELEEPVAETPEVLSTDAYIERANSAIPVTTSQELELIGREFGDAIKAYDAKRNDGVSLWGVWEKCQRMHDDNAMARQNIRQMQVILQNELTAWAGVREKIGNAMDNLNPGSKLFAERMDELMKLNERVVKVINSIQKTIRDGAKEIRQSEMQSRFWYHVNIVQEFMAGLSAIHFQHLQGNPQKLQLISKGMHKLAKMFEVQMRDET
jgi:hypothetical protein